MQGITVVELRLPSDVVVAMRTQQRASQTDEERVKVSLAVGLFADGTVSLAKAARLAGMTRYEFAMFLKHLGLAAYEYTDEEYQEDLAFVASAGE